jgi:MazG family protein
MSDAIADLLAVMRQLRDPDRGCPWDRAQDYRSLVKHTLEEAYEVADAVERGAWTELASELGDLLFQVVFYAQIATERGDFDFEAVVGAIRTKLLRRHPHVFGDATVGSAAAQSVAWEDHKAMERRARGAAVSELDDVPVALPGLSRAAKLQKRAARSGFDWSDLAPVLAKVDEELDELRRAVAEGAAPSELNAEVGDVLFAVVNVARHLELDPEQAIRATNAKFERRFRYIEGALAAEGRRPADSSLAELDALWEAAKRAGM